MTNKKTKMFLRFYADGLYYKKEMLRQNLFYDLNTKLVMIIIPFCIKHWKMTKQHRNLRTKPPP